MDLTQQFLAWVDDRPRTRADVMDAWRSSCPRLTIWEDAVIAGLVRLEGRSVLLTPAGRAVLTRDGMTPTAPTKRTNNQRVSDRLPPDGLVRGNYAGRNSSAV